MSYIEEVRRLQWLQLRHDEIYHGDIALLRIPARLTHFTMHLAKYIGNMVEADRSNSATKEARISAKWLDTLIILMSSANCLNLDLGKATVIVTIQDCMSFEQMVTFLNTGFAQTVAVNNFEQMVPLITNVGDMSKALEALDHMESFPSRETINGAVTQLFWHTLAVLKERGITDIRDHIRARLMQVESARWHMEFSGNYENGYAPAKLVEDAD